MFTTFREVLSAQGHQTGPAHDVSRCTEAIFISPGAACSGPFLTLVSSQIGETLREPRIHMSQQFLREDVVLGLVQSIQLDGAELQPGGVVIAPSQLTRSDGSPASRPRPRAGPAQPGQGWCHVARHSYLSARGSGCGDRSSETGQLHHRLRWRVQDWKDVVPTY